MAETKKKKLYPYSGEPISICKCGVKIFFVITDKGRKMPVALRTLESHPTDCPEAAKFRKGKQ